MDGHRLNESSVAHASDNPSHMDSNESLIDIPLE